jgi:hypothetical protein
MWTSTNNNSWQDAMATIADTQYLNAPAVELTGAAPSAPSPITAPLSIFSDEAPPVFQISIPSGRYYAVEVAIEADLFQAVQSQGRRTPDTFYATWENSPFLSSPTYGLPQEVWNRLRRAQRLYYRLWVSDSRTGWVNHATNIPDAQFSQAPFIAMYQRTRAVRGLEPRDQAAFEVLSPSITAPETYDSGRPEGPTFVVESGRNPYYAVAISSRLELFADSYEYERNRANFYGSWEQEGLLDGRHQKLYQLPPDAWNHLRQHQRLYYRLLTSASPTRWVDVSAALQRPIPSIRLTGRGERTEDRPYRPEEDLWRQAPTP